MRSSAPPYINLCYYGTDIGAKEDLIACRYNVEEIAKIIDVDSLGFLNVDSLDKIAQTLHGGLCKGCFTGKYPTNIPTVIRKNRFDKKISDNAFNRSEN